MLIVALWRRLKYLDAVMYPTTYSIRALYGSVCLSAHPPACVYYSVLRLLYVLCIRSGGGGSCVILAFLPFESLADSADKNSSPPTAEPTEQR